MGIEKVIGVDAQGGDVLEKTADSERQEVYQRATTAVKTVAAKHPDYTFYLVGNPDQINKVLGKYPDNIKVEPGRGAKCRAITRLGEMIEEKLIGGIYTCGNTKEVSAVVMSQICVMEEFAKVFPGEKLAPMLAEVPKSPFVERVSTFFALDVGSIPTLSKPEHYVLYAKLGQIYAEVMGRQNPSIGLLNIGAEYGKGSSILKEANSLLKNSRLNFIGNVEPYVCIYDHEKGSDEARPVDILVSNGELGNIFIKTLSTGASLGTDFVKEAIMKGDIIGKVAGFYLSRKAFVQAKKRADPSATGGSVFIGAKYPVFKNHGTFTTYGMTVGLEKYISLIEHGILGKIRDAFSVYND